MLKKVTIVSYRWDVTIYPVFGGVYAVPHDQTSAQKLHKSNIIIKHTAGPWLTHTLLSVANTKRDRSAHVSSRLYALFKTVYVYVTRRTITEEKPTSSGKL